MPNTSIPSPNNTFVGLPWNTLDGSRDTPQFRSVQFSNEVTTRDTIQRSATDGKLYRCLRNRIQQKWVQTSAAKFSEPVIVVGTPESMPTIAKVRGSSSGNFNNSDWNRFSVPGSFSHAQVADWDLVGYSIAFDLPTRTFTMTTSLETYSQAIVLGGNNIRELLEEDVSLLTASPVDTSA